MWIVGIRIETHWKNHHYWSSQGKKGNDRQSCFVDNWRSHESGHKQSPEPVRPGMSPLPWTKLLQQSVTLILLNGLNNWSQVKSKVLVVHGNCGVAVHRFLLNNVQLLNPCSRELKSSSWLQSANCLFTCSPSFSDSERNWPSINVRP